MAAFKELTDKDCACNFGVGNVIYKCDFIFDC